MTDIDKLYGNKLRVRVMGILIEDGKLLLVEHQVKNNKAFFCPPGGGAEFGADLKENLIREYKEETGLDISVGGYLHIHEFIDAPLHGIEIFFSVTRIGGSVITGIDPESEDSEQIIKDVKFFDWDQIATIPTDEKHHIFSYCENLDELLGLKGYFNLKLG